MPAKVTAAFTALVSLLCFWLAFILGLTGGSTYSVPRLIEDTFANLNPTSMLLVLWAVTLLGGLLVKSTFPRVAMALGIISPICGIVATISELWALHTGTLLFDFPGGEAMFIYMPRLTAASLMLAITLLGYSIQLSFGGMRSRVG